MQRVDRCALSAPAWSQDSKRGNSGCGGGRCPQNSGSQPRYLRSCGAEGVGLAFGNTSLRPDNEYKITFGGQFKIN